MRSSSGGGVKSTKKGDNRHYFQKKAVVPFFCEKWRLSPFFAKNGGCPLFFQRGEKRTDSMSQLLPARRRSIVTRELLCGR